MRSLTATMRGNRRSERDADRSPTARTRTLHQPGQMAATVMCRDVSAGSAASILVPCRTAALVMLYSRYFAPMSSPPSICRRKCYGSISKHTREQCQRVLLEVDPTAAVAS